MSTPTFQDLTTIPSQTDVLNQEVIPELKNAGVNVTSWVLGGVYRGMAQVVARLRTDARKMIATLTASSFEDYVFGRAPAPGGLDVTSWAPLRAAQRYGVKRKPATFTRRSITLTNSGSTAYPNVQPGKIILQYPAPSKNRYILDEVVTIPANGSVKAVFRSEFTYTNGSTYNGDPPDTTLAFVTSSFPGVTAANTAPIYSEVSRAGLGLGSITPSGTSPLRHDVTIKIVNSGKVGDSTAGWQWAFDGNPTFSATQSASTLTLGDGITVTLHDNSGNPAFIKGETYFFSAPGTDLVSAGNVAETPQGLGQRVIGLWPLLGFQKDKNGNFIPPPSPTKGGYQALTLSANDQVSLVFADADGIVNNRVNVVIAGLGGIPLPSPVIANVQLFFDTFHFLTDDVRVQTSTPTAINLSFDGGAIELFSSQRDTALSEMQNRLASYLGGTDAAVPLTINDLIDYDYILSLIRTTPGVKKVPTGTLRINGFPSDLQLGATPGTFEAARWTEQVTDVFPFRVV